jgi:sugar/nucleoside kinase (ribokinase family)
VKRLGVIGTMVWDTIYGRGPSAEPVEEWGGISYALGALEAALPPNWVIAPLVKVGGDLAQPARRFFAGLKRAEPGASFVEVPEPNNRVTLRYTSEARRTETLSGGVPPWTPLELLPQVEGLDVIYINFISGFEMSLETVTALRKAFDGPIYADLHSLLLTVARGGAREPAPLNHPTQWLECFDVVQVNEDEISLIAEDGMAATSQILSHGVKLLVVTLGARGAVYFTESSFDFMNRAPRYPTGGPLRTARIAADEVQYEGDPTGCGDVFGATLLARLVAGSGVEDAIRCANQYAARNYQARGATGLHYHLKQEISTS